jgi:hypothetical protein
MRLQKELPEPDSRSAAKLHGEAMSAASYLLKHVSAA